MRVLLRSRPWQLFALLVGLPAAFDVAVILAADSLSEWVVMVLLSGTIAGYAGLLYAWLWAVGVGLNATLPEARRWRTSLFSAANAYAVAYVLFFMVAFWTELVPWRLLVALHVSAMLATVYAGWFVVRTLVVTRFGALRVLPAVGTALLLWMLPIGVWVIQPWVNEATQAEGASQS